MHVTRHMFATDKPALVGGRFLILTFRLQAVRGQGKDAGEGGGADGGELDRKGDEVRTWRTLAAGKLEAADDAALREFVAAKGCRPRVSLS